MSTHFRGRFCGRSVAAPIIAPCPSKRDSFISCWSELESCEGYRWCFVLAPSLRSVEEAAQAAWGSRHRDTSVLSFQGSVAVPVLPKPSAPCSLLMESSRSVSFRLLRTKLQDWESQPPGTEQEIVIRRKRQLQSSSISGFDCTTVSPSRQGERGTAFSSARSFIGGEKCVVCIISRIADESYTSHHLQATVNLATRQASVLTVGDGRHTPASAELIAASEAAGFPARELWNTTEEETRVLLDVKGLKVCHNSAIIRTSLGSSMV